MTVSDGIAKTPNNATESAWRKNMNFWNNLTPEQIFIGSLLIGLGLMILFWDQLFPSWPS